MASETTVQTALWNVELGRGKRVVQWVVVVLATIALALVFTASRFRGLEKREAMDLAQLARNIARGEGYTTFVIRPLSLRHLKVNRPDHQMLFDKHPDLYNPPLYPWLLAGLFKLAGPEIFRNESRDTTYAPEQWLVVPFGQLCLVLAVWLTYLWAKQLFDQRVAITAGGILILSDTLWQYSISGLPVLLLMVLVLATTYCLFAADNRALAGASTGALVPWIIGSAILLGLCFLTRYLSFFLIVPLAVYVARVMRGRQPALWVALYAGLVLAVIAPWLIRNYSISHSLLGVAGYQFFDTDLFMRTYAGEPGGQWVLRSQVVRVFAQLRQAWVQSFRDMSTDILLFFFVVGLLYEFRREDTVRLRRMLMGCLVATIIGTSLVGYPQDPFGSDVWGGNLLLTFMPLVAVYGVAFFYLLLDRIQFSMRLTLGLSIATFFLVNTAPMAFNLFHSKRGPYPYPPYCHPAIRPISQLFDPPEVGASDAPWNVAWYTDRRCVWLPATPDQFVELHDFASTNQSINFILFTPYMLDRRAQSDIIKGDYRPWAEAVRGKLPDQFPLLFGTVMNPDTDQVLLADRPRWKERPIGSIAEINAKPATPTNQPPAQKAAE